MSEQLRTETAVDLLAELRRIADRLEIIDVFTRFGNAADARDWAALRRLFTPEVILDHTQAGEREPALDSVWVGLNEVMERVIRGTERHLVTHHMITDHRIDLRGDHASVVASMLQIEANPHADGRQSVQIRQGWYFAELVRTAEGWRIARLTPSLWKAALLPIAEPLVPAVLDARRRELRDLLSRGR